MVFIHGGGFVIGSSNWPIYDGAALSERGDVIVASINYRLGILGFFSAFTDDAPGSMGMYDQVLAIQWIKDNAKSFGGDPDNIVLFGESAGAFSISMHMISPLSKNLFNRGILQSGSVFSPLYSESNGPLTTGSAMVANIVGCAVDEEALKTNPAGVVDCMRNIPQEKIVEADLTFLKNKGIFIPRIGDDFLPATPTDLFRAGKSKHAEMLIGVTRDEGSLLLTFTRGDIFGAVGEKVDSNSFNEAEAQQLVPSLLHFEPSKELTQSYFEKVKEGSRYTYLNALSDLVGDFMLTCAAVFQADYHSLQNQPAYFYLFDYRPPSSPFAEWMGVFHSAELPYVFGNPIGKTFTDFEDEFSKDVMDMWTTFAKTGNPSILGGLEWPRYTYEDPKYLIIGQRDSVGVRPDNNRCEVFKNIFQSTVDNELVQHMKKTAD